MIFLILGIIITTILIGLTLFFVLRNQKKARIRRSNGVRFEYFVKSKAIQAAKNLGYQFIDGGLFKYGTNQFFELDGILISNKVVYIVEAKCYFGHLHGDRHAKNIFLRNNQKEIEVANPLEQNIKHIKHVFNLFGNINVPVMSLVVFPMDTTFDLKTEEHEVIVTVDKLEQQLIEIEEDFKEMGKIHNEEVNYIRDTFKQNRTNSMKDIKKFGKIIRQNEKHDFVSY